MTIIKKLHQHVLRQQLPSPPGEGLGVRPYNLPSPPGEGKGVRLLLIFLLVAFSASASNVVSLPTVTGAPGDEVTLTVSLDNTDAVSAVQVLVPVSDGLTVVAGSETLGSRAGSHSARVGVKDGMLNIMVWSNALTALDGNSGEVVSFRVTLGNEPQTIPLTASRVTLTDTDGNTLEGSATDGSVIVAAPKAQLATRELDFGHIPIRDTYHQSLAVTNVGNVPLTVTGIAPSAAEFGSDTPFPYVIEAGATGEIDIRYSPVERGAIEETVRLLSNNIAGTNTIRLLADPFAVNELHVENASGIADSTVTIHLRVNNMDAISGFQFEFDLPEQLRYVDGSFTLSDRKADHQLTVTCRGQHLTAIAWSLGEQTFSGEDGEIASFDVVLSGRYGTELRASKAVLTANYHGQDMNVLSDHYGGWIDIASPQLNATDRVDMGAISVTEEAQATINVYNGGGAPLRIDRVVFDTLGFSVAETFPLVIEPWNSVDLHVTYTGLTEAEFHCIMQLYSNDPDHHLHNIHITGSRFAPNYLHFVADDVVNGSDLLVHVDMSNYDPVEGLQFDLHYPHQWFTPTGEYTVTDRASGFSVAQRSVGQGVLRCFVYSLNDGEITPGEGRILTMPFSVDPGVSYGSYTLTIDNIKAGTSALTDKYAGSTEQAEFQVLIITYATSLTLDKDSVVLALGERLQLNATVLPENTTDPTVDWSSSDESVAKVTASGKVRAVGGGTANIIARTTDGTELSDTCLVRVAVPGDVNLDGWVDVTDVNILVNIILGKDQAANYDGRADVNIDDVVDVSDVNKIVNIILGKEVPTIKDYTEVDYIYPTTSVTYLSTPIIPTEGTVIEVQYMVIEQYSAEYPRLFSTIGGDWSDANTMFVDYESRVLTLKSLGNTWNSQNYDIPEDYDNVHTVRYEYANSLNTLYYDGALALQDNASCETDRNIILFNSHGPCDNEQGYYKVYSFKVWQSGELVLDLRPVVRIEDGKVGMLDDVTDTFYTTATENEFSAAPVE